LQVAFDRKLAKGKRKNTIIPLELHGKVENIRRSGVISKIKCNFAETFVYL